MVLSTWFSWSNFNGVLTLDDTKNDTETETANDNYELYSNLQNASHCTETLITDAIGYF